jgi:cytochrome P450
MAAVAEELELPVLDPLDTTLGGPRFHDRLGELVEQGWLARAGQLGFLVLDHEAVAFFMRSKQATFPGRRVHELLGVTSGPLYERAKGTLLDLQGEDHRRLRKLVQGGFTPAAADRRRPVMRELIEDLWARFGGDARCEFVSAFARPFPAQVIATVMGAPLSDTERLANWANMIQGQFDPVKVSTQLPELERAAEEFVAYARDLLHARQGDPRDDLISELIAAEEEGDRLSEEECVNLVSAVLVGGVDTTQAQIAHGLRLFAEHPDQWRRLAEDPSLAPAAAEEVLRYEPITPFTARVVLEDLEFRDVAFPAGTIVFACSATANREGFEGFDITADRGRAKPLTFGAGPHFCLGANLARAELQEAFAFLAPRMPALALDGEPEYDQPSGVYALRALPIRW